MLWRVPAAVGGVGGLVSLALPYAVVTGGTLGVDLHRGSYTLVGLADLLREAGRDPTGVYVVGLLVAVGSVLALVGALTRGGVAVGGGLVQGVAAAAFAYGVTTSGSASVLLGLGRMEVHLTTGFFVLVAATVVTAATALIQGIGRLLERTTSDA